MHRTSVGVVAAVLFVFTWSSGCATGTGSRATGAAANVLLPPAEEEKLGEEMAAEVRSQLTLLKDPTINSWISGLGNECVQAAADRPKEIAFDFHVVDEPETVNAFAMAGGHIYVYTGLIKEAANEAELMAVLCHEVAHVTQRHIAKKLVTMYGIQSLTNVALGKDPGLLGQIVAGVAANGYLLKYSRSMEREADSKGIRYEIRAGYDPTGYVTFFKKLEGGPSLPTFLQSHPSPGERVENAQEVIDGLRNTPTKTGEQRFKKMLAQL